ncbi:MAG: AAA family ATPase [Sandaracinaceae bacterium]|nr:AAA family ATPase [Sandaracinaceae bacterium]
MTEALERYVPTRLVGAIAAAPGAWRRLPAAVLVADLTGFTALSERLAQRGALGAEQLGQMLDARLGLVIDEVAEAGGEVVAFAGDAIQALWYADDGELAPALGGAVRCAEALLRRDEAGAELGLKVAVGAGVVSGGALGGHEGRALVALGGAEVVATAAACSASATGQLAWTEAARALGDAARRARAVAASPAAPLDVARLRALAPLPVLTAAEAGHMEWLAELRHATIVFFGLRGIDLDEAARFTRLDAAVRVAQEEVARFGGFVSQVVCDDKATTVLAAWGVPGAAHEDDAARAVRAANAAVGRLACEGVRVGCGVASGRTLCGIRGNARRAEYAVIGERVIVAARLMQHAADGEILVYGATAEAAGHRVGFDEGESLRLKGKTEPVLARRPLAVERTSSPPPEGDLFGRTRERRALARWLERAPDGRSPLVVVEGEAGIGKSSLLREHLRDARERGLRLLVAAGDPVELASPYAAWRGALRDLFALHDADETRLRGLGVPDERAPLLLEALGIAAQDTPLTRQLAGPARTLAIVELVGDVLARTLDEQPLVLVAEDAHWLDSASWTLLAGLRASLAPHFVVVVTRPYAWDALDPSARAALRDPDERMRLDPLPREGLRSLLLAALDADDLPPALIEFVHARGAGHPLVSGELALALRQAGCVKMVGRDCRVPVGAPAFDAVELPDTVEGLVARRLEHLGAEATLALKVASLLGARFTTDDVREVHPTGRGAAELADDLDRLAALSLLDRAEDGFAFHHDLTRAAVYSRMPFAQRRELHGRVARWLEAAGGADDALLAHHFQHAGELGAMIRHAERAAERALRTGASREAASHYERLLAIEDPTALAEHGLDEVRRARWSCHLGVALYALGDLTGSAARLSGAMEALGVRVPGSGAGWGWALATGAAAQALGVGTATCAPEAHDTVALAAQRLSEGFMWQRKGVQMLACTLISVNHAERGRTREGVARCYAMLGFSLGVARLEALGARYFARARQTAEQHGDERSAVFIGYAHAVYQLGNGAWDVARASIDEARRLAHEVHDLQELEVVETAAANLEYLTGELRASGERFERVYQSGRRRANLQHEAWGLYGAGRSWILLGEIERGRACVERALALYREVPEPISELICHGLLAQVHLAAGDLEAAVAAADETTRRIREAPPAVFSELSGYIAAGRVRLVVARRAKGGPEWPAARAAALAAVKDFGRYSFVFPIGKPYELLAAGELAAIEGREKRARKVLGEAVALAARRGMPYAEALGHARLSALHGETSEAGRAHQQSLDALLERIGATADALAVS